MKLIWSNALDEIRRSVLEFKLFDIEFSPVPKEKLEGLNGYIDAFMERI